MSRKQRFRWVRKFPEEDGDSAYVTQYWLDHYLVKGMCSLCGQTGIIHTEGLRSPGGVEVGRANYCICLNGQDLREHEEQLQRETRERMNADVEGMM